MSTPEARQPDRRTGTLTLASLGRNIPAAPPPPPPPLQAAPVPPPAAPRVKAVAVADKPKPVAGPVAPPPPVETEGDRRVAARIEALRVARELLPDAFADDAVQAPQPETRGALLAAGIPADAAEDAIAWQAEWVMWGNRRRERVRAAAAVEAREAALPVAIELMPDVFRDDDPPPVPDYAQALLREAGVGRRAAADVILWWQRTPAYVEAQQRRKDTRIERRAEALALIRELAPDLTDYDAPKPLAVNVHEQLIELGIDEKAAADALRLWIGRIEYKRALAAGGMRVNLDGTGAGEVSPEDQAQAAADIAPKMEIEAEIPCRAM
jgi:hypothetical protein